MRTPIYDHAKAIGIILVICGHILPASSYGVRIIYGFHMPLFFFISGALLKESSVASTWRAFFSRQCRSLIIPYAFFGVASVLIYLLKQRLMPSAESTAPLGRLLTGLLIGNGPSTKLINPTLWFFITLFIVVSAYYLLARSFSKVSIFWIALSVAIAIMSLYAPEAEPLPWNLDIVPIALTFYASGRLASPLITNLQVYHWKTAPLFGAILLMTSMSLAILNPARVDMREMAFGNTAIFFAAAFTGIAGIFIGCCNMPRTYLTELLSASTIAVFPSHAWVIMLLKGIEKKFLPSEMRNFSSEIAGTTLYCIVCLLMCIPLYFFLKRYLPIAIGGRTSQINGASPHHRHSISA